MNTKLPINTTSPTKKVALSYAVLSACLLLCSTTELAFAQSTTPNLALLNNHQPASMQQHLDALKNSVPLGLFQENLSLKGKTQPPLDHESQIKVPRHQVSVHELRFLQIKNKSFPKQEKLLEQARQSANERHQRSLDSHKISATF